ncbi:hypothetical protein ACLBOM_21705 [Escherichia coli]
MHHPDINLILATGGPAWLKPIYSGKPAIGVGVVTLQLLSMKLLISNVQLHLY